MRPKKYRHRASILVYMEQGVLDQLNAYLGASRGRSAFVAAAIRRALASAEASGASEESRCPSCGEPCADCQSRRDTIAWKENAARALSQVRKARALAGRLSGIELERRGREIGEDWNEMAKDAGLVIAYATHDDHLVLRGAFENDLPTHRRTIFEPWRGTRIEALRLPDGADEPFWRVCGNVGGEPFWLIDDGELFCEGLVFPLPAACDARADGDFLAVADTSGQRHGPGDPECDGMEVSSDG